MEPLKTIGEVAELFQISRSTAYRLKKADNWPHHRLGTELRFSAEDIEQIQAKYQQAAPEPRRAPRVGTRANRRNQK
jgi:excisionase family DNA binding protein